MKTDMRMELWPIENLHPAEYNPRVHLQPGDPEYESIARSIETFGYADPIIVNTDGTIIGGHQRFTVLSDLGYKEVHVVVVDLTKDKEKALNVALNKISGAWDEEKLKALLQDIDLSGLDMTLTGFSPEELSEINSGVQSGLKKLQSGSEENEEYQNFVDKFKPKLTTDDCYTPEPIYEAVKNWACSEYKIDPGKVVRPFWPGGDYQKFDYSDGAVVVDNPPFSILSEICRWYLKEKIHFVLFAQELTLFSTAAGGVKYIISDSVITFENGANIKIAYLTDMGDTKILLSKALHDAIEEAKKKMSIDKVELPNYVYPNEVITAAVEARIVRYLDQDVRIKEKDCSFIRALDSQHEKGKAIFGGGFLLSEKAAAEKAAAEKAAAEKAAAEKAAATVWELSKRERRIIKGLG